MSEQRIHNVLTMESGAGYCDDNHHTRSVHWTYELKTHGLPAPFESS